MKNFSNALGKHLLVEYHYCNREILNNVDKIREHMIDAAKECGATIVNDVFHLFNPHGVSGVVVIAESHLAIHTWPEYGFAAVDLFTCGNEVDPWKAFSHLKKKLGAKYHMTMEMKRGILDTQGDVKYKPANTAESARKLRLHAL
ncbi:MAG: S-adenosylmethionine decarboxylase proenzyme [Spirochaetes bacterium]|nr:S-adenosylmethionine decarboxylase proenzyme [Spirochaetota bacterium]